MTTKIRPNLAYLDFAKNFEEVINSDYFVKPKVKVFTMQTGGGKSHYQDREMPLKLKKAFPELRFIFRLSPTTEVAYDGTFVNVDNLNNSECSFSFIADPPTTSVLDAFEKIPSNVVLCVSCTHTYFTVNFEKLKQYASKSVLIIEEAHQFVGCADPGSDAYVINYGYSGEYTAETWQRISKWRDINPRILGFTATPTEHHKGNSALTDQFNVCGELAPLEHILPSQAWILNAKPYHFTKNQGAVSVRSAIENSIDGLFEREAKLQQLKLSDPNINTKLSSFYVCGDSRGVWGSSLADVRQIISNYLLGDGGYSESDMMIATMVENSSGGNTIWSLDGNNQQRYAKAEELFRKLQDENDPLRFLLVINRGRSGINVHNLTSAVICRIRDPKEVRTPIPIQIFGRMVRLNCGTGNIVRQKYSNNLDNYLTHYSHDYDVDIKTVIETIKIANVFDIYHPTNGKAKRTWEESLVEFEKDYVNNAKSGYEYLYSFTGIEKPSCVTTHISSEIPLNCPFCGENVEKKISEWIESGAITLDRFFE